MIKYRKRFSQNFLTDPNIAKKIVEVADIKSNFNIWEIGGGKGILTKYLLEKTSNLSVFEIDKELQKYLKKTFGDSITLFCGDFLSFDLEKVSNNKLVNIVANIPYNITTPILFKIVKNSTFIKKAILMVQKELAQRVCAKPNCKDYGKISLKLQYYFKVKKLFNVKAHLFYPKPKVDSTVICLEERMDKPRIKDNNLFWKIIDLSFAKRRKMLRSNLTSILSKEEIILLENSLQFSLSSRGESISEDEFLTIYKQILKLKNK